MAIVILIIDRYVLIEILDNCLIPFIEHRSNVFVWERYLKNYDISSELDPIENLWWNLQKKNPLEGYIRQRRINRRSGKFELFW